MLETEKVFGTTQIARLCHVSAQTVGRWIEGGKLPFFTTAGGHRRVFASDLVSFLTAHNIPVPAGMGAEGPPRILIVDDDPGVRMFVRRVAAEFDGRAQVREAADGFDAGRLALELRPSLVFLDVFLPGIDGLKVCRSLRADPRLARVRIVAVSGRGDAEMEARCREAGADAFLAKPVSVGDLRACLSEQLSAMGVRA